MIQKLFSFLKSSKADDMLFLTGVILNVFSEENKKNDETDMLPELFTVMGIEGTITLIKFFSGKTIRIPKHEDLYKALLVVVVYYKHRVEGKDYDLIKQELNLQFNTNAVSKIIEGLDNRISLEYLELQKMGIEGFIKSDKFQEMKKKVQL